jgi:hypothetical protein
MSKYGEPWPEMSELIGGTVSSHCEAQGIDPAEAYRRMRECMNALEGLNPAAVRESIELMEVALSSVTIVARGGGAYEVSADPLFLERICKVSAALAKVREA